MTSSEREREPGASVDLARSAGRGHPSNDDRNATTLRTCQTAAASGTELLERGNFYRPRRGKWSSLRQNKLHRLTETDRRLAHYYALFWGLGLRLGYLVTSGAKSDVTFLLGNPDFL